MQRGGTAGRPAVLAVFTDSTSVGWISNTLTCSSESHDIVRAGSLCPKLLLKLAETYWSNDGCEDLLAPARMTGFVTARSGHSLRCRG
jgi:hypothetical protein